MSLKSTSIIGLILALACNSQKGGQADETVHENAALTASQSRQEQPSQAKEALASDSQEADEVEEADEDANDDADEVEEADEDANDDADEAEQDDGGDSAKSAASHGQRGTHGSSE